MKLHFLPALALAAPLAGLAPAHAESASAAASCAALQEALPGLVSLQAQYHDLAGTTGEVDVMAWQNDPVGLYRKGQELSSSLHQTGGELRDAEPGITAPKLHASTVQLADMVDEGTGAIDSYLADPFSALRPEANEQLTDLAQRGLASFVHFQNAYQASCGALPTDGIPAQLPPR
ncbi:hypothetical protein [Segniliparus rugosus]|uniref:Uncharacterized protein n=1 Tax=Segniliparus rugosus (strain ATCC BAA-974 / DSM 45345 / CCUG 50838 / CIP 108380 / JCM 13579 / CDC 945) TaxID=679197 RepID=E5XLB4_SEGRC|nr:hypothetical protein [Segniliparus rugosus]EFV14864.1 hypothetical protein HMPREF9336_00283 [Segniliparus rugosus ATCC BAA-974]